MTSVEAIEKFLILSKQARGKSCEPFIQQLVAAPQLYNFSKFLKLDNIVDISTGPSKPYYDLLQLFAYGTYSEYINNKKAYPELTATQIKKLRQLTLLEIASKDKLISYSKLLKELGMTDVKELEDFIIECIYNYLIEGKINQQTNILKIFKVVPRDAKESELADFKAQLRDMYEKTDEVESKVSKSIKDLNDGKVRYLNHLRQLEEEREAAIKKANSK